MYTLFTVLDWNSANPSLCSELNNFKTLKYLTKQCIWYLWKISGQSLNSKVDRNDYFETCLLECSILRQEACKMLRHLQGTIQIFLDSIYFYFSEKTCMPDSFQPMNQPVRRPPWYITISELCSSRKSWHDKFISADQSDGRFATSETSWLVTIWKLVSCTDAYLVGTGFW